MKTLNTSNKEVNALFDTGNIQVNGIKAGSTYLVSTRDEIKVNGKVLQEKKKFTYIRFYKPRGIESTLNKKIPDNLLTVFHYPEKLFPVGRLDQLSEGLMILTNDGDYCSRIINSENEIEKEYLVKVNKDITEEFFKHMREGVVIMGKRTLPAKVIADKKNEDQFYITLTEGKNRQIRRMCYKLGYEVEKLKRIRIMDVDLGELRPGKWEEFRVRS